MSKRSIVLPEIQYPDIVNYLENTVSAYTLNDMKAYKYVKITVGNECPEIYSDHALSVKIQKIKCSVSM